MRFATTHNRSTQRRMTGFTLTELLVVIIIIAILAAILFPVIKGALERSRISTSISNMNQIGQALARYQQDHDGKSPSVLFGYAGAGGTMQSGPGLAKNAGTYTANFPGLYPAYIKDFNVFIDPNNQFLSTTNFQAVVNVLCPSTLDPTDCNSVNPGVLTAVSPAMQPIFYAQDSYDLSPEVTGVKSINPSILVPRYQSSWTSLDNHNELRNPHPNGSTYVTLTTYHVKTADVVLVLYEDGSVHTISSKSFLDGIGGSDVSSIGASGSPSTSASNVWQLNPTGGIGVN